MSPRIAVTVRSAVAADVPELSALARRTWSDAYGDAFTPEDASADAELRRSETFFTGALEDSVVLLAERDGAMVGYVKFGAVGITEANATERDRELHRLYVEVALHGSGIGSALLAAALAHPVLATADRVFLNVWEQNTRAWALYGRFGFAQMGVSPFSVGAEMVEDAVMVRPRPSVV